MNTQLINILKKETQSLKDQFIALTQQYALNEFNQLNKLTYKQVNEKWGYFDVKWNRYFQTKKSFAIWRQIEKMQCDGLEKFIANAIENAIDHYENSIVKLAIRIEKKGLDINLLKCTTSHIGRNIDTTLTDGNKIVRAFTIIAEGEIQKPHYRYLIK